MKTTLTLSGQQIAEAIRNYVQQKNLCPKGTTWVGVVLDSHRHGWWFQEEVTFKAHVTFKNVEEDV